MPVEAVFVLQEKAGGIRGSRMSYGRGWLSGYCPHAVLQRLGEVSRRVTVVLRRSCSASYHHHMSLSLFLEIMLAVKFRDNLKIEIWGADYMFKARSELAATDVPSE